MIEWPKKPVATPSLCYVLAYRECLKGIAPDNQGVKPDEVAGSR